MNNGKLLVVKTGGRMLFLETAEIDFISAEGNYVRIHCSGHTYLVRETLGKIYARLNDSSFLRISRSTVINIHSIRELSNRRCMSVKVVLSNKQVCYWSRSYRPALDRLLEQISAS